MNFKEGSLNISVLKWRRLALLTSVLCPLSGVPSSFPPLGYVHMVWKGGWKIHVYFKGNMCVLYFSMCILCKFFLQRVFEHVYWCVSAPKNAKSKMHVYLVCILQCPLISMEKWHIKLAEQNSFLCIAHTTKNNELKYAPCTQ